MLSAVPINYTDIRFFKLLYDSRKQEISLVTLFYGEYPLHIKDKVDTSAQADREGNKPIMCIYQFSSEFWYGLASFLRNTAQERTLF